MMGIDQKTIGVMKTIRIVALPLLIVLAGCLASCNQNNDTSGENETEPLASETSKSSGVGPGFVVSTPEGWGDAPLLGRMKWHIAANDGTSNPDCFVIVTEDWSFEVTPLDDYIKTQTKEHLVEVASTMMSDVVVDVREDNFELGGQRAVHLVYSATVDSIRLTSFTTQTIRSGKLYTFGCNDMVDSFPLVYVDLLKIQDSFQFVD